MKTTLNLPAGKLLWQVFLLHPLEDEMLTCKEIYVEGPCGKFKLPSCGNCLQSPTVYRDAQDTGRTSTTSSSPAILGHHYCLLELQRHS